MDQGGERKRRSMTRTIAGTAWKLMSGGGMSGGVYRRVGKELPGSRPSSRNSGRTSFSSIWRRD